MAMMRRFPVVQQGKRGGFSRRLLEEIAMRALEQEAPQIPYPPEGAGPRFERRMDEMGPEVIDVAGANDVDPEVWAALQQEWQRVRQDPAGRGAGVAQITQGDKTYRTDRWRGLREAGYHVPDKGGAPRKFFSAWLQGMGDVATGTNRIGQRARQRQEDKRAKERKTEARRSEQMQLAGAEAGDAAARYGVDVENLKAQAAMPGVRGKAAMEMLEYLDSQMVDEAKRKANEALARQREAMADWYKRRPSTTGRSGTDPYGPPKDPTLQLQRLNDQITQLESELGALQEGMPPEDVGALGKLRNWAEEKTGGWFPGSPVKPEGSDVQFHRQGWQYGEVPADQVPGAYRDRLNTLNKLKAQRDRLQKFGVTGEWDPGEMPEDVGMPGTQPPPAEAGPGEQPPPRTGTRFKVPMAGITDEPGAPPTLLEQSMMEGRQKVDIVMPNEISQEEYLSMPPEDQYLVQILGEMQAVGFDVSDAEVYEQAKEIVRRGMTFEEWMEDPTLD